MYIYIPFCLGLLRTIRWRELVLWVRGYNEMTRSLYLCFVAFVRRSFSVRRAVR